MSPTTETGPSHLVRLGATSWQLWREAVLRSAGFPAAGVRLLADPELAAAADRADRTVDGGAAYQDAYCAATRRLTARIRQIASDPRFREAVAWQNRQLVGDCVDKAAAGEPRNVRGRNHELAIAGYWQRYCMKNDTIGFFGPVAWASWSQSPEPLRVVPGAAILDRRTTYFEVWAIDALGEALAGDPELLPWLSPRQAADCQLDGAVLHRPSRGPVLLTEAEAETLQLVDGHRVIREIGDELLWSGAPGLATEQDVIDLVLSMRDRGLLRLDLEVPVSARPEQDLRRMLERVGSPELRRRVVGALDELVAARDQVATAAGDVTRLLPALDAANETFRRHTGRAPVRRPGVTYGGRTILYEDTTRDVTVEIGRPLLEALSAPLGLLLDSARWFVAEAAERYREVFDDAYARASRRSGETLVPLASVLAIATPSLFFSLRELPEPVRKTTAELQHRWEEILKPPAEGQRHQVSSAEIAPLVRRFFPETAPAWSEAIHHSPDVMLATTGPQAVDRGDYLFVLGELHLASNTVESRLFVEQHPDPDRLRAMDAADHGDRRVYLIPPKHWQAVNSRTYPPSALLSPRYAYWSLHADAGGAPGRSIPAAALLVEPVDDRLVVRTRDGGLRYDLLETTGELLSAAVVNGFRPLAPRRHRPRVTVDRLVMARESWTIPAAEAEWASLRDESRRFREARAWRRALRLPERAFYKLPTEDKPAYVDFSSLVLVNMLAKGFRKAMETTGATVSLTELLPDHDSLWLRDHAGERYTSELRLVAVDPSGASTGRPAGGVG
ncbi:lantibiotic dehydratase [Micromonospora eburnea]|uniref:Lantibiotic dehydratase, C terminus n=1 Tax=Micromonospora eburnea TaxID=227316 RepID=A0A1C6V2P4_9ACTN|nr:lantibiotic dehydratase [Micromonospora eburnea]SCL60160.1 Lantibiotic dehydratase, C terminus [Micromonospora eburnea]